MQAFCRTEKLGTPYQLFRQVEAPIATAVQNSELKCNCLNSAETGSKWENPTLTQAHLGNTQDIFRLGGADFFYFIYHILCWWDL